MNANKKVFWWSCFLLLISIASITVFNLLNIKYPCCSIYLILLNVFISMAGGALISCISTIIMFCQLKKQSEIKFFSEIKNLKNILLELVNWFNWKYANIDYTKFSIENNDKIVADFVDIITKYINYDCNEIYYILDDYCSFIPCKRNNQTRLTMYALMNEINNHNILYDNNMNITLSLYKQKIYPSFAIYKNIITIINNKYFDKSEIVNTLNSLLNNYLDMTDIDKYTKKIAVSQKTLKAKSKRIKGANK